MSRSILFFALLITALRMPVAEAQSVPPVSIRITGDASPELLADFRQALRRMEARRGAQTDSHSGTAHRDEVDLGQFWKVEPDVAYTLGETSPRQRLTIVYPFEGDPPYRTLVYFHGGHFHDGDGRSGSPAGAADAAVFQAVYQGYALVTVGYRLADEAIWPAQLHDAKAAIRFLRANSGQYELDTDQLVVWGRGSGGYLAQMLGATNGDPVAEDPAMGYQDTSSVIQGIVSEDGISDLSDLPESTHESADALAGYTTYMSEVAMAASPVFLAGPDFPPILLIHHTDNQAVPFEQSARMAIRVNARSGESKATLSLLARVPQADNRNDSTTVMSQGLDFADALLFTTDRNPHRSSFYPPIQTRTVESDTQEH